MHPGTVPEQADTWCLISNCVIECKHSLLWMQNYLPFLTSVDPIGQQQSYTTDVKFTQFGPVQQVGSETGRFHIVLSTMAHMSEKLTPMPGAG
jgi:hypothetical protein